MFIAEGVPAILLGVVTFFYLTDYPREAQWLLAEEKAWLEETLESEHRQMPLVEHHSAGAFFADKRLWALGAFYFFWNLGNLGIMFWLPTILKSVGNLSNIAVGFLFSCPFLCALIGMNAVRWYSDRTGERKRILVVCSMASFVFLAASAFVPSPAASLILICLAAFNIWGLVPIFWTLPADYLGGVTAAAGIAFISSWTGVGGFAGPYIVGLIKDATGRFPMAVFAMGLAFLIQGCIVMAMKIDKTRVK
jgi:sugar phosphate permease